MNQILYPKDIAAVSAMLHKQKQRIVVLGGCFDILHIGHISLLHGAKKAGDSVIVFLESDKTITTRKGPGRPIHTQMQRAEVLAAVRYVDYILLLPDNPTNTQYEELTKMIQPAIIATTENDPEVTYKIRQAEITHAKVVFVNKPLQDVSTTNIAAAIQNDL